MKKLVILLIAVVLLVSLSSCLTASAVVIGKAVAGGVTNAQMSIATKKASKSQNAFRLDGVIEVSNVAVGAPNAKGKINFSLSYKNLADKAFADVIFIVNALDSDGNYTNCSLRRDPELVIERASKLSAGGMNTVREGGAWYNKDISGAELSEVQVVFEDGSSVLITRAMIEDNLIAEN